MQLLLEKGTDESCDLTAESSNVCDPVGVPDASGGDPGEAPAESCSEPDAVRKSVASCCDPDSAPDESCSVPGARADESSSEPVHVPLEYDQPFEFDLNVSDECEEIPGTTTLASQFENPLDSSEQSPPEGETSTLAGEMTDQTSDVAGARTNEPLLEDGVPDSESANDEDEGREAGMRPNRRESNSKVQPQEQDALGGNLGTQRRPRRPNTRYSLRAKVRDPSRLLRLDAAARGELS